MHLGALLHPTRLAFVVLHASSVNMFKNRIDKYLVKAGYTSNNGRLHLE